MTIAIAAYSGTATIGTTEWSLTTNTAGPDVDTNVGVYQAMINLSALAAGDEFEFTIYEKATGATAQVALTSCRFVGAQGQPGAKSVSLMLGNGWDMTLKKIAGTDRSITWSIAKVS